MIILLAIEICVRRASSSKVHWVAYRRAFTMDELEPVTGCGLRTTGMVSDKTERPGRVSCKACQEELVRYALLRSPDP